MLPASAGGDSLKQQVVDNVPKTIKEIQFGILYVSGPLFCASVD